MFLSLSFYISMMLNKPISESRAMCQLLPQWEGTQPSLPLGASMTQKDLWAPGSGRQRGTISSYLGLVAQLVSSRLHLKVCL